jgi:GTP-binding protein
VRKLPKDKRPHVAVAGRSNVGKSSLLNKLMGRKSLAKVSATPGKTQTINLFLINNHFYFADLPGYGYAKVPVSVRDGWKEMIEQYLTQCKQLAGMILLLDSRREPTEQDAQLLGWLSKRKLPSLIAITKADKINRNETARKMKAIETQFGLMAVATSTLTGVGKRELLGAVGGLVKDYYENSNQ